MKFMIPMFVMTMIHGMSMTVFASGKDDANSVLDRVLGRYVSEDGMVNYKGLQTDKDFPGYIKHLSSTNPDTLPSEKHLMAFWINAYNAFVLKGVVEEYPIKSVLDVGWLPHSFFKRKEFVIQQGKITLQKIENEKLRVSFREPRIHFAINCASMSCPKLLPEAYRAETLEQQLETQAISFINNKSRNYLDKENKVLYLSSIFKWYKDDFVRSDEKIEGYIAGYLNPEDAEFIRNNTITVKYLDYDWGLNEQR